MTSLDHAREIAFSLSPEEQRQLGEELMSRHHDLKDEEVREIEKTLQERLDGPFVSFETPEEHDAYIEGLEKKIFSRTSK